MSIFKEFFTKLIRFGESPTTEEKFKKEQEEQSRLAKEREEAAKRTRETKEEIVPIEVEEQNSENK